jgi:hypothetical protein
MNTLTTYTTKANHFTGPTAQSDLAKSGKIDLKFYIHTDRIGVEVAGFTSAFCYWSNPKTPKQKNQNNNFIERYVKPCYNSEELLNTLFI